MTGEEQLKAFAKANEQKKIWKINSGIYFFTGYGHSNCTALIGDTSVILIDSLDCDTNASVLKQELEKITDKPVKTIIFTHGHPDHRGGSGVFRDTVTEVIAFTPSKAPLPHYDRIQKQLMKRGAYQFGYGLTDEEAISQGIGIREARALGAGAYDFLAPTTTYDGEAVSREIDGISLELVRAPGESDDQIFIWLERDRVICTGDTYYGCWPNLYAIRGTQYRDVAEWADSLKRILSYPADTLLPGHLAPLTSADEIRQVVGTFRDALQSVLFQTLDCLEQGMTAEEAAKTVRLPKEYADAWYLGEYYGTIEWSVKGIYAGYVGWFDGRASRLMPVAEREYADAVLELIGSREKVLEKAAEYIGRDQSQLALQLLELLDWEPEDQRVRELKRKALLKRAGQMTSANARHYFIASAKEL